MDNKLCRPVGTKVQRTHTFIYILCRHVLLEAIYLHFLVDVGFSLGNVLLFLRHTHGQTSSPHRIMYECVLLTNLNDQMVRVHSNLLFVVVFFLFK